MPSPALGWRVQSPRSRGVSWVMWGQRDFGEKTLLAVWEAGVGRVCRAEQILGQVYYMAGKTGSIWALRQFLTGLLKLITRWKMSQHRDSNVPSPPYMCTHVFFQDTLGAAWQYLGLQRAPNPSHLSSLIYK